MRPAALLAGSFALLSEAAGASPNEACVICSFLMESVDRIIKAQPAGMNGNQFHMGRVDFGGGVVGPEGIGGGSVGENQALRDQGPGNLLSSFPGAGFQGPMLATLLETKAVAKARAKARGRRAVIKRRRQRQANSRRGASANDKVQQEHAVNTKATKATGTDAQHARIDRKVVSGERRSALKAGSSSYSSSHAEPGSEVDNAGSDLDDAVRAQSEADQTNPNAPTEGQKEVALDDVEDFIGSKSGGESGEAEFDEQQVESEDSEKDLEFSQTYKQFMDALEETCKYDMPEQFAAYCKPMFDKGEKIVEYYLHDYDDEDICTYVQPQCTEYFQLTSR